MEGELVLACHVWLFFSVLFLFSYDVHQQCRPVEAGRGCHSRCHGTEYDVLGRHAEASNADQWNRRGKEGLFEHLELRSDHYEEGGHSRILQRIVGQHAESVSACRLAICLF